jgi:heterotetrameric sarcosine oxidase gamma subunit
VPNLTAPVARSAILVPGPRAVVASWDVSTLNSSGALRLCDVSPLSKVQVRAELDGAFAASIGVGFRRSRRRDDGTLVIGSGPGEWLLIGAVGTAGALMAALTEADLAAEFVTAVDLTHGRALMRLTGLDAHRVLSKVCAVDLADGVTPDGAAFRSSVAKIATDVVRDDVGTGTPRGPSYLLHCERSSGQYLFDCLLDAGREFDIEPDGSLEPVATDVDPSPLTLLRDW